MAKNVTIILHDKTLKIREGEMTIYFQDGDRPRTVIFYLNRAEHMTISTAFKETAPKR